MVDVLIEEIGAPLGQLGQQGDRFGFRDVTVLFEVGLQVAEWGTAYPPEQYSRKK